MTINKCLPVLWLSATLALLACCVAPPSEEEGGPTYDRVSLQEATRLVRRRVFELNPKMNSESLFPLRELHVDGLWARLDSQIFQVTDGVQACTAFLVHHGKAEQLCGSFGGHGIQSACVTDLDGNGEAELTYTWSSGSGIHRSHVVVCRVLKAGLTQEQASACYTGDLFVRKASEAAVAVEIGQYGWEFGSWKQITKFGDIELMNANSQGGFEVRVALADLPEEHSRKIRSR